MFYRKCIKVCFCIVIIFLIVGNAQAVSLPSYDQMPITSKSWKEVDLKYFDLINGKRYPAEIKLLRPISWLKEKGMYTVGNRVTLSIPEFGVNHVYATVVSFKKISFSVPKSTWKNDDCR